MLQYELFHIHFIKEQISLSVCCFVITQLSIIVINTGTTGD